jgi:hypothetical protein
MVSVVLLARKAKQRMAEIGLDQAPQRVTLIVQDQQKLKSVKTLHVQTPFLEKNGNAEDPVQSQRNKLP